jgi:hypothetical protein
MAVKKLSRDKFIGLSTDTKPVVPLGSTFFEYDLQRLLITIDGVTWTLKQPPLLPTANKTIDLEQAAASYDLFEIGDSDVRVLELTIIIPADLTGAAAGALTSISIQSTDTTPVVFVSSTAGAKANLTAGAHLRYTGNAIVEATKKIQLTIAGGATTDEQIALVYMTYAGVV